MNKDLFMKFSKGETITEEEFKSIVRLIRGTYPPRLSTELPFMANKETFDVWYELIKDKGYLPMFLGVKRLCITNKYPPTLADIVCWTDTYAEQLSELDMRLDSVQENISVFYPKMRMNEEDTERFLTKFVVEINDKCNGDIKLTINSLNSFMHYIEYLTCTSDKEFETFTEIIDKW